MTALDNQRRKAYAIGPYMARTGVTREDVRRLPYASKDRKAPTQRAFARAAYAAAYREAAGNGWSDYPRDLAEPSGPDSETWDLAEQLRVWIVAHPGADMPGNPWYLRAPGPDLAADRPRWVLLTEEVTEDVPAPIEEVAPCLDVASPSSVSAAVTRSETTTSTDDVGSPSASPVRSETPGGPSGSLTSVLAVGDWPSDETGTCSGCGARHRRYGPKGGGALCPSCRAVALGRPA